MNQTAPTAVLDVLHHQHEEGLGLAGDAIQHCGGSGLVHETREGGGGDSFLHIHSLDLL